MKVFQKQNLIYKGADNRASLLDVIFPKTDAVIPIVIFAHGFKGYKDWGHFPLIASELANSGYCVIKFNFSHNGGTIENPIDFPDLKAFAENNYLKELIDLSKVLEWIENFDFESELGQKVAKNNISLIGHSRGGGIAICAAAKHKNIKKLITWSAVADFKKRLPSEDELKKWKNDGVRYIKNARTKQQMPMNYSFVEALYKNEEALNIKNAIEKMDQALLVVHGTDDEAVPVLAAKDLVKWNPKAKIELIEGAGHTYGGKHPWKNSQLPEHSAQLLQATLRFLSE